MVFRKNLRGGGVNLALDSKFKFAFFPVVLFTLVVLIFSSAPAIAEDGASPKAAITDTGHAVEIGDSQTQLVVDKENNIIRIMIEGKEVGRFDKNGLHVVGDVNYTGTITDIGVADEQ